MNQICSILFRIIPNRLQINSSLWAKGFYLYFCLVIIPNWAIISRCVDFTPYYIKHVTGVVSKNPYCQISWAILISGKLIQKEVGVHEIRMDKFSRNRSSSWSEKFWISFPGFVNKLQDTRQACFLSLNG